MSTISSAARRPWSAVPDTVLEDYRLSTTARLVLAWMLGRPPGWRFHVEHVLHTLGIGREAWRSARRQLQHLGYLKQTRRHNAAGRIEWELVVVDEPIDWETISGATIDWFSVDGEPVDITNKCKHNDSSSSSSKTLARVCARDVAAAQKARRVRPSGIVTWIELDMTEAEKLEREATAEDLAEAVQRVRQAGKEPVPGLVARELERLTLARETETRKLAAETELQKHISTATKILDSAALKRGAALLPSRLQAKLKNCKVLHIDS